MRNVGLSPRLKNFHRVDNKADAVGGGLFHVGQQRRLFTDSKNKDAARSYNLNANLTPLLIGNDSELEIIEMQNNRNQAMKGNKSFEPSMNDESHLKLILKLQEDKVLRKKREDDRRSKMLEKYVKQVEEKQKVD